MKFLKLWKLFIRKNWLIKNHFNHKIWRKIANKDDFILVVDLLEISNRCFRQKEVFKKTVCESSCNPYRYMWELYKVSVWFLFPASTSKRNLITSMKILSTSCATNYGTNQDLRSQKIKNFQADLQIRYKPDILQSPFQKWNVEK